jgi:hypothetical protein
MNATLIINGDDSRCGRCGKGADPTELAHVTVLTLEGWFAGCGARFVSASSDVEMT